ncbi:hypothetical protein [Hymenobacter gelipurpurascens]|uniref:hypothetical protein n=1 Tax=Hymenobacter gelipurpurascens TaxID=89968 RepID=UPI000B58BB0F|nr:hypothetical protein [Hymenobacter gelipurpurascens]
MYFALDTVVPAAPPALWWTIGLGLFSGLNLLALREIWPHTPHADDWFLLLGICCFVLLPWLVARTAGRVAAMLQGCAWRIVWRLASWGAYATGAVALIPGAVVISIMLTTLLLR